MSIKAIIEGIDVTTSGFKPHKLLMLFAIAKYYELGLATNGNVFFSEPLVNLFSDLYRVYARKKDRNRPHTPFFHLKSMPFWTLVPVVGKEKELTQCETVGGPSQLIELVDHAMICPGYLDELIDRKKNLELQKELSRKLSEYHSEQATGTGGLMNSFVRYVNSLNNMDSDNKGALAEAQATEPLFCEIQVPHPWAQRIVDTLTRPGTRSVILSGHAGDGKSTVIIEVLKKLLNVPENATLPDGLQKRQDLPERGLVVIKDLSEWNPQEKNALFSEMLAGGKRYLLVSNTGTLLDLFKAHANELQKRPVEIENLLLTALDASDVQTLDLSPLAFEVYNLAQQDNVGLAMVLFDKLVDSEKWAACAGCSDRARCPIAFNHALLEKYQLRIRERIERLYARIYAYGSRLTMRQIGAHFASLITGGLRCDAVHATLQGGQTFAMEQFCFFNRFWGDDGQNDIPQRAQLRAFTVLDEQEFNTHFSPQQERSLWQHVEGLKFQLGIPELDRLVARTFQMSRTTDASVSAAARRQLRRMVYFLYEPEPSVATVFEHFQLSFLNSATILDYRRWQTNAASFRSRRAELLDALFCVLQEQFSGITPPEGTLRNRTLYITLSRQNKDIRQSAQVVLRSIEFLRNFSLVMENRKLVLKGIGADVQGIRMPLSLPFLDYIVARKAGELGGGLQLAYRDRLEKLMAQLVDALPPDKDRMTLLKQGEDGTLSTETITLDNNMMEVTYD